jgi:SAM-dependent methyltransferase
MLADETVAELIVELLPPGGRVLDVGCGGGHTLRALARRGVEGIGIDPHPYGRAPCRRLRAEEISALEEQFDLIYTLHALHEFDAPERFPREAKDALRPGGVLLIMDWVRGAGTGVRERYFTSKTVAGWMADAGFDILQQEVRGQTMILVGRMPIPGGAA